MVDFLHRYGPWAIVAGASEGLGAAFAMSLAARGINVFLIARRADALEATRAEIVRRFRVEARCLSIDLGDPNAAQHIVESTQQLDVGLVVYNAAHMPLGDFLSSPIAEQSKAIDVNLRGMLSLSHLFGARLVSRGRGGLIFLSSLAAFQGSPGLSTYGATKSFTLSFAEGLWHELAPRGVDVLAVCPGATRTPGYLRMISSRTMGELNPEEVAEEALANLSRGPLVIPGLFNRFASFLMRRLLPRRKMISMMGEHAKKLTP